MNEAKSEIEAYLEHKVRSMGLQALAAEGEIAAPELEMLMGGKGDTD